MEIGSPVGPDRGVSPRRLPPAEFEFLEAVVMGDLITLGMNHVPVAIPNLDVLGAFPLFHDFVQRR